MSIDERTELTRFIEEHAQIKNLSKLTDTELRILAQLIKSTLSVKEQEQVKKE
jgi:hypothetical protein